MRKLSVVFLGFLCLLGMALAQEPGASAPEKEPPTQESEDAPGDNESAPDKKAQPEMPQDNATPKDAPAQGEKNLDIIFAIDASASLTWTDPGEFRKAVAKALMDITQKRGGGKVAVVQFAGWNESAGLGSVFDLTEVSSVSQLRQFRLFQIRSAISSKIKALGKGTDFNYAFKKIIWNILDEREKRQEKNKVWIILISDGSMNVVEGNDVREAYRAQLIAQGKPVNRPNLNQAATEIFKEDVLPTIASKKDLFITCINTGKEEPGEVFVEMNKLDNVQLLNTSEENLKSVFVAAFSGLPKEFCDYGIARGFAYLRSETEGASEARWPFHIYQGTTATHLFLLSATTDFSIDILKDSGDSILSNPGVTVIGDKEPYRLVSITNEPFGEYSIVVTNKSASASTFEFLEYVDFNLAPYVGTIGVTSDFYPGQAISVEAGLRDAKTVSFITDPNLVAKSEVLLRVRDVDGNVTDKTFPFKEPSIAKSLVAHLLPKDAPGGEYELIINVAALKETVSGNYAYMSKPISIPFSVLSPLIDLRFSQTEALIAQYVEIIGNVVTGSLAQSQKEQGLEVTVTQTESHSEKKVHLSWDEEKSELRGQLFLDELDEWQIRKAPLGKGVLKPGEPGKILIKPRDIRVFAIQADDGKVPVKSLVLAGKLDEPVRANLVVETDVAPGETPLVSTSFNKIMQEAQVTTAISGTTLATTQLSFETPSVPVSLDLNLTDRPDTGEVGDLVITAKFRHTSVDKKVPVATEIPPEGFPWIYAAIAGAALLLIIVLLVLLASGPKFDQQQLHIVGGTGHLLSEWKRERSSAVGTAEIPATIMFKLKGSKHKPTCLAIHGKTARVFINNIESTNWTELSHGDSVEIYPAEDEYCYRYRYFDRAPTAAELEVPEDVTQEIGTGVFLGEDEFILADEGKELEAVGSEATQALIEEARRMKEHIEHEGTEILAPTTQKERLDVLDEVFPEEGAAPAETLQEAPATAGKEMFGMPEEPTQAIVGGYFEEAEEVEATEILTGEGEAVFEEMGAPTEEFEAVAAGEEPLPEFPVSEELDSEATQALTEEVMFEDMDSEPTQAIVMEPEVVEAEPTEELGEESEPVDELAESVEEHLEMSEFLEEGEGLFEEPPEEKSGRSLADQLDKTFDDILDKEEEEEF